MTALHSTEEERAVLLTCVSPASWPSNFQIPLLAVKVRMLNCSGDDGQKGNHLLTNRLSGKVCFLILWSSSAWALRGVLVQVDPPPVFHSVFSWLPRAVSEPFHCAFVHQNHLKTLKKRYESGLFLPLCHSRVPVSIKHLHDSRYNKEAHVIYASKSTLKCQTT